MSIAILTKWGNSVGIRIPASDLKVAHAYVGEHFKVTANSDGSFVLTPLKSPREGWLEAFNAAAKQDEMLVENVESDFDKDEWQW